TTARPSSDRIQLRTIASSSQLTAALEQNRLDSMSTTADQSLCWTRSNLSALGVRMRVSRLCSLLVLALFVAVSARAQTRDLEHLLAGKTVPLSIQLKELTSD